MARNVCGALTSGETGNILYVMSETYAAKEGVGAHLAKSAEKWPAGLCQLVAMQEKYGIFMVGGFTCGPTPSSLHNSGLYH